jgi:hypothetical protein
MTGLEEPVTAVQLSGMSLVLKEKLLNVQCLFYISPKFLSETIFALIYIGRNELKICTEMPVDL